MVWLFGLRRLLKWNLSYKTKRRFPFHCQTRLLQNHTYIQKESSFWGLQFGEVLERFWRGFWGGFGDENHAKTLCFTKYVGANAQKIIGCYKLFVFWQCFSFKNHMFYMTCNYNLNNNQWFSLVFACVGIAFETVFECFIWATRINHKYLFTRRSIENKAPSCLSY